MGPNLPLELILEQEMREPESGTDDKREKTTLKHIHRQRPK